MSFLGYLKSLVGTLTAQRDSVFSCPVSSQQEFLSAFAEPGDNFDRAYDQYRCQIYLAGKGTAALYHLASMILLPIYRHQLFSAKKPAAGQLCDAVFLFSGDLNLLPESLQVEFPSLIHVRDFQSHFYLAAEDKKILSDLRKRYPTALYFRLKCMLKLGMYRWFYETYHPKAMIVSSEYSFTSSFLTEWCEQIGVEHINVMHGEKLFYIRDSFFRFHRFYIWDDFYRDLFTQLRADESQFRVEVPPAQRPWSGLQEEKAVDYTYYLQIEDGAALRNIAGALQNLREQGFVVAVRPHPVYSEWKTVSDNFGGCIIEDPKTVNIQTSILRTRHVISAYSTVLLQAYTNSVPIVIDDISNHQHFQQLRKLQYQMLSVEHTLLSAHTKTMEPNS